MSRPSGWTPQRLRFAFDELDRRLGSERRDLPLLSVSIHHGVRLRDEMTDREARADEFTNYKCVEPGDLVINRMRAFEGGAGLSGYSGIVSSDYAVLRARPALEPRFLHHLIRSRWFVGEMTARLRGIGNAEVGNVRTPRINVEDLGNIEVALPPRSEQVAIADYLDAETVHIDSVLAARQSQLTALVELRMEGTRALFAGSDPHRRIPWMPPLDSGWTVVRLRWLAACLDGRRVPVNREERAEMQGDVPYWGANGIVDWVNQPLFSEPLVLLGEDGAPFFDHLKDKAFYVNEPIWPNNHIHVLRATGIRPKFLALYLNLVDFADFVEGSTRDKLTQDSMGSIPVPVPPIEVQMSIELAAEAHRARLDQLRARVQRQIDLLLERRQTLITAAVTGQLEIPGVAA